MTTRKNKQQPQSPKNIFKFNIIWVYAIIAVIFFGLQMLNFDATKQTSWQEFNREMLQQQKVEKVVNIFIIALGLEQLTLGGDNINGIL